MLALLSFLHFLFSNYSFKPIYKRGVFTASTFTLEKVIRKDTNSVLEYVVCPNVML